MIQDLALNAQTYDEVVEQIMTVPVTSVGNFIIGGTKENEGIVITRDIEGVGHKFELSDE